MVPYTMVHVVMKDFCCTFSEAILEEEAATMRTLIDLFLFFFLFLVFVIYVCVPFCPPLPLPLMFTFITFQFCSSFICFLARVHRSGKKE